MSQRDSGYERKERDAYETPEWATMALLPHLPRDKPIEIWEPACGSGKMVRALSAFGNVVGTDIETGKDFLACILSPWHLSKFDAIITNPPYALAREFIEHALEEMRPGGIVAMLLRTDYDHANGRKHLFSDHPAFAKKVVLTKRIQWFEDSKGAPSFNHAWFIWDWTHKGPPTLAYGPVALTTGKGST